MREPELFLISRMSLHFLQRKKRNIHLYVYDIESHLAITGVIETDWKPQNIGFLITRPKSMDALPSTAIFTGVQMTYFR